ncbi:BTAD domain-containing putative transcriptional regulator [Lysinibacillus sp. NPDC093190]|uniref:BTAD domain-containing putative transcriptional regulator n=1 Tax=Lysinibacillus sp. NPDC093190 TaxID=3390575 RepID=UPI003D037C35
MNFTLDIPTGQEARTPKYNVNGVNFNPSVKFDNPSGAAHYNQSVKLVGDKQITFQSIYQLRKHLKEKGIQDPIRLVNNHYQLNVEIASDYDKFIYLLEQKRHDEISIQQLLNYYEGDFLAEEEYSWAIQTQLRLKQGILHVLEMYITTTISINSLLKLNCLQKMLELDEFNENYMFLLLEFLIGQNKKQDCIKCYERIQEKLSEIGISVPEKILSIYNAYMIHV